MKKLVWILVPALMVFVGATWFINTTGGTYPLPQVLDSNARGMLLSLPVVATDKNVTWQPDWVESSQPGRKAVTQALIQVADELEDRDIDVSVLADAGSPTRKKVTMRLGDALAQQELGGYRLQSSPAQERKVGVVLRCTQADGMIARRILGALAPYLGGRVALLYTELPAGTIELELLGEPFFNSQGQAAFDPNLYSAAE